MVDKTLEELLIETQQEIYQVSGMSVQVYSQDLLAMKLIDAFIMLAEDPTYEWKRFKTFETYTLDGTTGRATETVTDTFKQFGHVLRVYPGTGNAPLVHDSINYNPTSDLGTTPLRYVPDTTAGKLIRIIPITSTGSFTIVGLSGIATSFELDDVIPFDYMALKLLTAWNYMTDDGSNPASAEKARQLFQERLKQLVKQDNHQPIAINGRGGANIPLEWYAR